MQTSAISKVRHEKATIWYYTPAKFRIININKHLIHPNMVIFCIYQKNYRDSLIQSSQVSEKTHLNIPKKNIFLLTQKVTPIFLSHVDPYFFMFFFSPFFFVSSQRIFRKSRLSTPKVAQVRIVRQSDECGRGSLQAGCDLTDPMKQNGYPNNNRYRRGKSMDNSTIEII